MLVNTYMYYYYYFFMTAFIHSGSARHWPG
jgi:hypothetical protein